MTIKNLIQYFKVFTDNHPILRTFSWGNLSDYSREDYITEYPAIHFVPQPSSFGNNSQDISFSVLIYDLLNEYVGEPTNSNQLDSMALCEEIMGDFINDFINQLTDYGYFLNMPVSYSYFVDRFKESVCGVEVQITITIEQTACIPPSILPQPIVPNTLTGIFAWYDLQDSSTITLTGGTSITQLLDKSGNNYTLTPLANPPSYQKVPSGNLIPYYSMEDTENTALVHNIPTTQFTEYTIFYVSDVGSDGFRNNFCLNTGTTYSNLSTWRDSMYGLYSAALTRSLQGDNQQTSIQGITLVPYNSAILIGKKGSAANDLDLLASVANNLIVDTGLVITTSLTDTFEYIVLGHPGTSTGNQYICEAIIYDRKLTDDETNGVLKYLQDKYNQPFWT